MSETFCIYCQREYQSPRRLVTHIKRQHPGTYAYYSFVPTDEQEEVHP